MFIVPVVLYSNVALAVHPDETYVKIRYRGQVLILAEARVGSLLKGQEYEILDGFSGKELEGTEYEPLFKFIQPEEKAW